MTVARPRGSSLNPATPGTPAVPETLGVLHGAWAGREAAAARAAEGAAGSLAATRALLRSRAGVCEHVLAVEWAGASTKGATTAAAGTHHHACHPPPGSTGDALVTPLVIAAGAVELRESLALVDTVAALSRTLVGTIMHAPPAQQRSLEALADMRSLVTIATHAAALADACAVWASFVARLAAGHCHSLPPSPRHTAPPPCPICDADGAPPPPLSPSPSPPPPAARLAVIRETSEGGCGGAAAGASAADASSSGTPADELLVVPREVLEAWALPPVARSALRRAPWLRATVDAVADTAAAPGWGAWLQRAGLVLLGAALAAGAAAAVSAAVHGATTVRSAQAVMDKEELLSYKTGLVRGWDRAADASMRAGLPPPVALQTGDMLVAAQRSTLVAEAARLAADASAARSSLMSARNGALVTGAAAGAGVLAMETSVLHVATTQVRDATLRLRTRYADGVRDLSAALLTSTSSGGGGGGAAGWSDKRGGVDEDDGGSPACLWHSVRRALTRAAYGHRGRAPASGGAGAGAAAAAPAPFNSLDEVADKLAELVDDVADVLGLVKHVAAASYSHGAAIAAVGAASPVFDASASPTVVAVDGWLTANGFGVEPPPPPPASAADGGGGGGGGGATPAPEAAGTPALQRAGSTSGGRRAAAAALVAAAARPLSLTASTASVALVRWQRLQLRTGACGASQLAGELPPWLLWETACLGCTEPFSPAVPVVMSIGDAGGLDEDHDPNASASATMLCVRKHGVCVTCGAKWMASLRPTGRARMPVLDAREESVWGSALAAARAWATGLDDGVVEGGSGPCVGCRQRMFTSALGVRSPFVLGSAGASRRHVCSSGVPH